MIFHGRPISVGADQREEDWHYFSYVQVSELLYILSHIYIYIYDDDYDYHYHYYCIMFIIVIFIIVVVIIEIIILIHVFSIFHIRWIPVAAICRGKISFTPLGVPKTPCPVHTYIHSTVYEFLCVRVLSRQRNTKHLCRDTRAASKILLGRLL